MIKTRIAKRYARALFELASEEGSIEQVGQDLAKVKVVFTTEATVRSGLTSPVNGPKVKAQVLGALVEAMGLGKMFGNFLRVVLDARKIEVLPLIEEEYSAMADEATGKLRGVATAPAALDEAALKKLSSALTKALGKEVILVAETDPTLLGGVVARVGNLVFDASVKTQLQRMKETLVKG